MKHYTVQHHADQSALLPPEILHFLAASLVLAPCSTKTIKWVNYDPTHPYETCTRWNLHQILMQVHVQTCAVIELRSIWGEKVVQETHAGKHGSVQVSYASRRRRRKTENHDLLPLTSTVLLIKKHKIKFVERHRVRLETRYRGARQDTSISQTLIDILQTN